jgi:hypothetical protein
MRCGREIPEKILGKEKTGERNNKKKNEMAHSKVLLHVVFFFLAHSIKYLFYLFFFFYFSNAMSILQI